MNLKEELIAKYASIIDYRNLPKYSREKVIKIPYATLIESNTRLNRLNIDYSSGE